MIFYIRIIFFSSASLWNVDRSERPVREFWAAAAAAGDLDGNVICVSTPDTREVKVRAGDWPDAETSRCAIRAV